MTEPLLPDSPSDEREVGWGDDLDEIERDPAGRDTADDARLTDDRPPHYDRD